MSSMIVCKFEAKADQKAIEKALNKHFPGSIIEALNNTFYLNSTKTPEFCKILGLYNQADVSELEKIAAIMTKPNYNKKIEKYDRKSANIQKKLREAKQLVKLEGNTGLSGVMIGVGTTNREIIDNLDKKVTEIESDKKVARVLNKLEKHRTANQLLDTSKNYSSVSHGGGISSLISIGVSTEVQSKNINKIIESIKNPDHTYVETSTEKFKEAMSDLLKVVPEVSLMIANDGEKSATAKSEFKVALNDLTANNLLSAKNLETLVITK